MYHIYDKNPFVCVIPSITIAALFGEFVCVPCSPSIVAQSRFLSHRLWSDEPISGSHNTGQPNSRAKLVFGLLLSYTIASPRKSHQYLGKC